VELPPEICRASILQKYDKMYIVASRCTIIHTKLLHIFLDCQLCMY
jgi:hypothetical protein